MAAGALLLSCAVALAGLAVARVELPVLGGGHPEARRLLDAGVACGAWRWELIRVGSAAASALVAGQLGLPSVLGLLLGAGAPSLWLSVRFGSRRERASRETTRIAAAVHAGLVSGAALPDALRRAIAGRSELAARPFRTASDSYSIGRGIEEALRSGAATADPPAATALATLALGAGERLSGHRLAALAGAVTERLQFQESLHDEVRGRTAGLRFQVWAMALLVPAFAGYLVLTVPTVREALGSELGTRVLLPFAAVVEFLGILLSRRALRNTLR